MAALSTDADKVQPLRWGSISARTAMVSRAGALVAIGNTSRVMRWGRRHVIKILNPETPSHWAALEASWTASLHEAGLPVPEVVDLVEVEGRPGIVFTLIPGPTMLEAIIANPGAVKTHAQRLAEVQAYLHRVEPPAGLPWLRDRLSRKMSEAASLSEEVRARALGHLGDLDDGHQLCHGDLHPGNIVLASAGPVVLDWFDVAVGHPFADVVRTSIMVRPRVLTPPPHYLPGSTNGLLEQFHWAYLHAYLEAAGTSLSEVATWEFPVAAARLCEQGEHADLEVWLRAMTSGTRQAVSRCSSAGLGMMAGSNTSRLRVAGS